MLTKAFSVAAAALVLTLIAGPGSIALAKTGTASSTQSSVTSPPPAQQQVKTSPTSGQTPLPASTHAVDTFLDIDGVKDDGQTAKPKQGKKGK